MDIITDLISGHGYSEFEENASALKKEVLHLLNHDSDIKRKARLQTRELFNLNLRVQGLNMELSGSLFTVIAQRVYVDGTSMTTSANNP